MQELVKLTPVGQPGRIFEQEIRLRKDDAVEYGFSVEPTDSKVEFNTHAHHGDEVEYLARGYDIRKSGTFRSANDGKYYLMWKNDGTEPATLRFWLHVTPKKQIPRPAKVLIVA